MSKFRDIHFPFYGLIEKPYKVIYEQDKIYILKTKTSARKIINDSNINKNSYLEKLINMPNRVTFDITCRNMQELIHNKPKWGIDNKETIRDLTKPIEYFEYKSSKIIRKLKNFIWVKEVSYPFEIPDSLKEISINSLFAGIVLIDNIWYLFDFSSIRKENKKIRL